MSLFFKSLYAQRYRVMLRDSEGNSVPNLPGMETFLSRARAFWTIIWDKQESIFHHDVHNHIYAIEGGSKAGSLRSMVMAVLETVGLFLDSLAW